MTTEQHDSKTEGRGTLNELLRKVEGASRADRELDAWILCTLLAPDGSKVEQSPINHAWCVYEPRAYGKEPFALWSTPSPFRQTPLTESIDAVVALCERVLPGAEFELSTLYGIAHASLPLNAHDGPQNAYRKDGNLPLAFIAAILQAVSSRSQP